MFSTQTQTCDRGIFNSKSTKKITGRVQAPKWARASLYKFVPRNSPEHKCHFPFEVVKPSWVCKDYPKVYSERDTKLKLFNKIPFKM